MAPIPVVLVHGFASRFECDWRRTGWADVLEDEGREVRAIDLPGHATTPFDRTPAESVLVAAGTGPVDGVGFSAGGHALLSAASRRPGAFRRLAALGLGSLDPDPDRTRASALARDLESGEEPADPFTRRLWRLADRSGNDRHRLARLLRTERERLDPEALRRLELPVLLVIGDGDFTGSGEELASLLPRARRVVLEGVDHFGTLSDLRCIEAVVEFLSG
jgi:pimeloyl-ACP methyl ester carboxylesterase